MILPLLTHNLTQKQKTSGRREWSGEGQIASVSGQKSAGNSLKSAKIIPDRSS